MLAGAVVALCVNVAISPWVLPLFISDPTIHAAVVFLLGIALGVTDSVKDVSCPTE